MGGLWTGLASPLFRAFLGPLLGTYWNSPCAGIWSSLMKPGRFHAWAWRQDVASSVSASSRSLSSSLPWGPAMEHPFSVCKSRPLCLLFICFLCPGCPLLCHLLLTWSPLTPISGLALGYFLAEASPDPLIQGQEPLLCGPGDTFITFHTVFSLVFLLDSTVFSTAYFMYQGVIYAGWNDQLLNLLCNQFRRRNIKAPSPSSNLSSAFLYHSLILLILKWNQTPHTFLCQFCSLSMLFFEMHPCCCLNRGWFLAFITGYSSNDEYATVAYPLGWWMPGMVFGFGYYE